MVENQGRKKGRELISTKTNDVCPSKRDISRMQYFLLIVSYKNIETKSNIWEN